MTSAVPGLAALVYRDDVIPDTPSSGAYEPPKVDIRSLFSTLGTELDGIAPGAAADAAAAEAAAAAAEAAAANAATGYLSFATTAEMEAFITATDNQTAYDAETDSYYAWDDGGSAWVFVRTAESSRLTVLEGLVLPVTISANHTVTGDNENLDVDTTAGEVTITLKAAPDDRSRVTITDIKSKFSTHNCIIAGNGKTIGGTGTSVRCAETVPVVVTLIFDDAADTWRALVAT